MACLSSITGDDRGLHKNKHLKPFMVCKRCSFAGNECSLSIHCMQTMQNWKDMKGLFFLVLLGLVHCQLHCLQCFKFQ